MVCNVSHQTIRNAVTGHFSKQCRSISKLTKVSDLVLKFIRLSPKITFLLFLASKKSTNKKYVTKTVSFSKATPTVALICLLSGRSTEQQNFRSAHEVIEHCSSVARDHDSIKGCHHITGAQNQTEFLLTVLVQHFVACCLGVAAYNSFEKKLLAFCGSVSDRVVENSDKKARKVLQEPLIIQEVINRNGIVQKRHRIEVRVERGKSFSMLSLHRSGTKNGLRCPTLIHTTYVLKTTHLLA